jgi:hypothetical protein
MKGTSGCHVIQRERPQPLRPSPHLQPPADAAVRAAYGRQPGRTARTVSCRPTARRADVPAWSSDEPALFGLRAHRVGLTRRHNDRSPP